MAFLIQNSSNLQNLFSLKTVVLFICLQINLLQVASDDQNYFSEIESLSPSHRKTLENFKTLVSPVLPHDYMKDWLYLLRFLQFNNFNIQKSEKQLKEAIKFRQDNRIEELLENPPEVFKELQKDYPIYNDGFDKEGRPIAEIPLGFWKIRASVTAGKLKNVTMHMQVNGGERAIERIREQQAKGINVTQFVLIMNMDGFSVADQVCPSCLPLFVNLAAGNDRLYPNAAYGFWLINTPSTFSHLFRIVRPIMSASARQALKIFTSDESQWKPFLEKHVDFSELSDWYGGAKIRRQ